MVQAAREEKVRAKEADKAADVAAMGAFAEELDRRQFAKEEAERKRQERLTMIASTLGHALGESIGVQEAKLEVRIAKVVAERDKANVAEQQRRREVFVRRIKECHVARQRQVAEKNEVAAMEREVNRNQAEIFRTQRLEAETQEREKQAKSRKARQNIDETLIQQMREQLGVHLEHFGITPAEQRTEVALNKEFFQHMVAEGFAVEQASTLLKAAKDTGKLAPNPSVARYEGEIHPLELEEPPL